MNLNNPYATRWRWWYSAIADWMIANPGRPMKDCAADIGRSYNAISLITSTDMFRDYLEKRKAEWRASHDFTLADKLTKNAEKSLDLILAIMEKKGDTLPMKDLVPMSLGLLDRLGYAPATGPHVQVNNIQQNVENRNQTVVVPVSAAALEEARDALRAVERRRAETPEPGVAFTEMRRLPRVAEAEPDILDEFAPRALGAEPSDVDEGGEDGAPLILNPQ